MNERTSLWLSETKNYDPTEVTGMGTSASYEELKQRANKGAVSTQNAV